MTNHDAHRAFECMTELVWKGRRGFLTEYHEFVDVQLRVYTVLLKGWFAIEPGSKSMALEDVKAQELTVWMTSAGDPT